MIAQNILIKNRCRGPLSVNSVDFVTYPSCPIYPQQRTFVRLFDNVAMGKKATMCAEGDAPSLVVLGTSTDGGPSLRQLRSLA